MVNVHINIEFLFLDVVDPMNQPAVLINYGIIPLMRGIQFINPAG